jgi:uncharacterized protein
MNANKFFYILGSFLLLLSAFIIISPSLIAPDFIYPERIDSAYVAFHVGPTMENVDSIPLTPADVNLKYTSLSILNNEKLKLKGWYVSSADTPANTILIIHDLNQSKLMLIDYFKQFHDRGLNVCAFDLRAHGESEGTVFSPGLPALRDMKLIIDELLKNHQNRRIILMGLGIGSAIAMQAAVSDGRIDALILQSPFDKLTTYLNRYSYKKWGGMKHVWLPVFERKAEKLLGYPVRDLDLKKISGFVMTPTFFITGAEDDIVYTSETLQVYESSAAKKKDLFLVRNAGHVNIAAIGGEKYYNRIAAFINTVIPRETKKTRFKKLVFNDLQRIN